MSRFNVLRHALTVTAALGVVAGSALAMSPTAAADKPVPLPIVPVGALQEQCGQTAVQWTGLVDNADLWAKPAVMTLADGLTGMCVAADDALGLLNPPVDPAGLRGQWSGTWSKAGRSLPATMDVGSGSPFMATYTVAGCSANVTENGRRGSVILASEQVFGGDCVAAPEVITITQHSITMYAASVGTTVTFRR